MGWGVCFLGEEVGVGWCVWVGVGALKGKGKFLLKETGLKKNEIGRRGTKQTLMSSDARRKEKHS